MTPRPALLALLLALLCGGCARPCPPELPRDAAAPAPVAQGGGGESLVLRIHPVGDIVAGDPERMERVVEKVRAGGACPGGSVAAWDLTDIAVRATPGAQQVVEGVLRGERGTRTRYFDVRDLLFAHPAIDDEVRPLLRGAATEVLALRNGVLIVRAAPEVLDAIGARLEAIRAG